MVIRSSLAQFIKDGSRLGPQIVLLDAALSKWAQLGGRGLDETEQASVVSHHLYHSQVNNTLSTHTPSVLHPSHLSSPPGTLSLTDLPQ